MRIKITQELSIPALANKKYQDLSLRELDRNGWRVIGGDQGDLYFKGFTLDEENNKTILYNPHLATELACADELTEDEIYDIAMDILMASYASIGAETVEHS